MSALILVDIQNDFLPGGALPVPRGDEIIPLANTLLNGSFSLKLATKDWHPAKHESFEAWPAHCVQNTWGAEFPNTLNADKIDRVFFKGADEHIDSYSAFFDNEFNTSTELEDYLITKNIEQVFISGLAIDYCVLYSVLDACRLGFETYVVVDACRGIDLKPGDTEKALKTMQNAGARLITTSEALEIV